MQNHLPTDTWPVSEKAEDRMQEVATFFLTTSQGRALSPSS